MRGDVIQGPRRTWRVKASFKCTTRNVVFAIRCSRCSKLYVGETKRRLADRVTEHLRSIRLNTPSLPVATHFNQPGHFINDLQVCVAISCDRETDRKLKEEKLIYSLGTLAPHGMNVSFRAFPIPETKNRDVLLTINNLTSGLTNSNPLAILECLTDIGPNICLVVERNGNETWLFAFHLDEEGNRPIVKELFTHKFDKHIRTFPFLVIIPPEAAFDVNAQYTYECSTPVEIILKEDDLYMKIGTDMATFVSVPQTLTLNRYKRIDENNKVGDGPDGGIPVAISTSTPPSNVERDAEQGSDDYDPMCVEGNTEGPLGVVVFPPWMTEPGEIPQNNMFFLTSLAPRGDAVFEAANTTEEQLYISSVDNQDPSVLIASLEKSSADFRVIRSDS
ncbi:uncharacterized protein LOC129263511 [Lytechinus pictus]|uniref:uncharacterized protein LOC129263511 n=1 Tax=Lytechinus pictus TaxID=7653 RepID=UPI0030B9E7B7